MISVRIARFMSAAILIVVAVLGAGRPSFADSPPDFVLVLPAGLACSFELRIEIRGGNQVNKEFSDKNGNVVRSLSAGKGSALTFTNTTTSATLSLKPNGAVAHGVFNPDGSQTWVVTGHNILIFFPTDVPAGPTTTLYVGRVVYTVDSVGVWTLQEVNGQATDICAALA